VITQTFTIHVHFLTHI